MGTQIEEWKAIADSNGTYYISNHGQVKSYKFGKERILKPGLIGDKNKQYLAVDLILKGKRKSHKIHRLVAMFFVDNPNNKPQVNHKDGDKLNNHFHNLEWVTSQENTQHGWKNGLCEGVRNSLTMRQSKPVIDCATGKKYNSLKLACIDIGEPYSRHQMRYSKSSKLQRFFYIDENGNG
jgi:hypothetical protein